MVEMLLTMNNEGKSAANVYILHVQRIATVIFSGSSIYKYR
jgi:hypothetical protein